MYRKTYDSIGKHILSFVLIYEESQLYGSLMEGVKHDAIHCANLIETASGLAKQEAMEVKYFSCCW